MPKAIDSKLIEAIKKAYLTRQSKPSLASLAKEFGVGETKVKHSAREGQWTALRDAQKTANAAGRVEGAKAIVRASSNKIDAMEALNTVIADIAAEATSVEAKSKEGCANALANLLKTQRELYPPDVDELAEIAVRLGITPNDFLSAIQKRWAEKEQLERVS